MSDVLSPVILDAVSKLPRGAIKSIQRGFVSAGAGGSTTDINLTIATVNPAKCLVVLNASYLAGNAGGYSSTPALKSLTATSLLVTYSGMYTSAWVFYPFSWQVIEFN